MPKISGSNIAEHVKHQEAAIFAAGTRLFADRGVDGVSMGAIAEEVGLARPSLYRYFSTKGAIVLQWFDQAMTPLVEASNRIAAAPLPREVRFDRWMSVQIDFLADAGNQAMISASLEMSEMSDEDRRLIGARHRELYGSLAAILSGHPGQESQEADVGGDVLQARVLLIVSLLQNFAKICEAGVAETSVRSELVRAAGLIGEVGES